MKSRAKPCKKCPECSQTCHARLAECNCGYIFYIKKNRNQKITNWQELKKGDTVKSVKGHGPFWINPDTHERKYTGHYGKFIVTEIGKDYIMADGFHKNIFSGYAILYMGNPCKSDLSDNLYNYPHKLVRCT
tara:strand:+ start:1234 stop:1629 length:396 start_codon:yes stop_codon:yes gene_type:complete